MLKAVIFDMDGVIIDSEPIHAELNRKLFNELGVIMKEDELNTYVGTTSLFFWQSIKEKFSLMHEIDYLISMDRNNYHEHLINTIAEIKPIEGVYGFLEDMYSKGIKMAIASSSPLNVIEIIVKGFNIDKYFDCLITGDAVSRSKPNPDIFLFAAKKLGVKPDECIVIEDSYNGVTAAKRAEIKVVGYVNPNSGNQNLTSADLKINHFNEINYAKLAIL